MEYLYCAKTNFEDFASGRVLYSGKGIPNFPVRLLCELYGRAKAYCEKKSGFTLYDPCCGGGYALTALGFLFNPEIQQLYGSDIDATMLATAQKNVQLLTAQGMLARKAELTALWTLYQKPSHQDALRSCECLEHMRIKEIEAQLFQADCTKALPPIKPDIIITDVPYGNLVAWESDKEISVDDMLEQLSLIAHQDTVRVVCMDKKQKITCEKWRRQEKHTIGKRRFEIFTRM